jgi:general secretion pathway protein A
VNNKMLALYGLKWNPFTPNVPTEALHVTTRLESFCWRVQQLAGDGGFALVTGVPGCGKSAALRILTASLATQRDVTVGVISRPQANIADFYREMGDLFGVELRPHNRWGGAKILRQRWQAHIQTCWPATDGSPNVYAPMNSSPLPAVCGCVWRSNAHHRRTSRTACGMLCSRPVPLP